MATQNNAGKNTVIAKEAYEAKVGLEALHRAGRCPRLNGHVHEVLYKDVFNLNPKNILEGKRAVLTKSNTAQMKDVVIMKGKKVVGHVQLKDTTSNGGVSKTIKQINEGHYGKTKVLGTKETAAKLAGKTKQKVESSGISSETTKRIADKALGRMPSMNAVHLAGKSGGTVGAAVGAGVEALSAIKGLYDGDKTVGEAVGDVTFAAVKGGVTGYASSAGGVLAAGATSSALAGSGIAAAVGGTAIGAAAVAAAPAVVAFGAACAIGSFVSDLFDFW